MRTDFYTSMSLACCPHVVAAVLFFRVENRPSMGVECTERGVREFIWRFSDDMKERTKRKQKRAFKKHGRRTVRSK